MAFLQDFERFICFLLNLSVKGLSATGLSTERATEFPLHPNSYACRQMLTFIMIIISLFFEIYFQNRLNQTWCGGNFHVLQHITLATDKYFCIFYWPFQQN